MAREALSTARSGPDVNGAPTLPVVASSSPARSLQHTFLIARLLFAAVAPIHAFSDYVHKLLNAVQRLMVRGVMWLCGGV